MSSLNPKNQAGIILPTLLIVMVALTVIGLSLATFALNQFAQVKRDIASRNALLTAEAGAEATLLELNNDNSFSGYSSEEVLMDETGLYSTYETEVLPGDLLNEKIIFSTGRVYVNPDDATPSVERKIKLLVVGTTADDHAVQTGPGGLIMSNTATIANGSVHINGFLEMSGNSKIGNSNNPVHVYVAHYHCPAGGGANYPELCSEGQPATITSPAHIYGEVHATNQTEGANMSNPGLIEGSSAEPVDLPGYDRAGHIERADASGITRSAADASCSGSQEKTWLADTHITGPGDVTINNNCTIIIQGDVWIDGSFTIRNTGTLIVDSGITSMPNIMIDGGSGFSLENGTDIISNENGIGVNIVTFWSTADCSPDCETVSGQDLYDSGESVTISLTNNGSAAGSFFYARWSRVVVQNNGSLGGVMGQTVELRNSANIYFGDQLSSGDSIWSVKSYQQVFD